MAEGWLCHGDYNQHHVLLSREGTAITDFGRCHFGVQTGDLAHFFRKILEKQNWDKVYGNAMLGSTDGCARFQGRSRRIFGYGFPIRRNSGSWPITITAAGKAGFPRKMSKN
ncbi:MAG: phosphotransferase [Lachnospiraceae bacterium]